MAEAGREPRIASPQRGFAHVDLRAGRAAGEVRVVEWEVVAGHAGVRVRCDVVGVLPVARFFVVDDRGERVGIPQRLLVRTATE